MSRKIYISLIALMFFLFFAHITYASKNRNTVSNQLYYYNFINYNNSSSTSTRYLIITADSLKAAFEDFALSKAFKGYKVKITSVDSINNAYTSYPDLVERIKRYIFDYYQELESSRTFVLLGGDISIIPTRRCVPRAYGLGITNNSGTRSITADLYYACFNDSFDWNANGNYSYGELYETMLIGPDSAPQTVHIYSDHASIYPNIDVARLPVRNVSDINNYMKKFFRYERGKIDIDNFYKKILFAGSCLYYYKNLKSDANNIGDSIVDNFIVNSDTTIDVRKLYDTSSSFSGKSFLLGDLQEVLSEQYGGYNLMNVFSHGQVTGWKMEDSLFYDRGYASQSDELGAAIITTGACYTAGFADSSSLGMSFILNPNNNTIAYWGSSNLGWVNYTDSVHGSSYKMLGHFYRHLINDDNKMLGSIIYNAKQDAISEVSDAIYTPQRFLQLSQTLLGDAEFSIYLTKPLHFTPFDLVINGGYASMNPYDHNAKYVLLFQEDEGIPLDYTNIFNNIECIDSDFLYQDPFEIGITKEGYAPFRSDKDYYRQVIIQATDLANDSFRVLNCIIGENIVPDYVSGENAITVGKKATFNVGESLTITDSFTCPLGASLIIEPLTLK